MGKGIRCKFFFDVCDKRSTELSTSLQDRYPGFFPKEQPTGKNTKRPKPAPKLYRTELDECRRQWSDLIYTVCEGRPESMRELKRFEVHEFFDFVENYKRKQNARS